MLLEIVPMSVHNITAVNSLDIFTYVTVLLPHTVLENNSIVSEISSFHTPLISEKCSHVLSGLTGFVASNLAQNFPNVSSNISRFVVTNKMRLPKPTAKVTQLEIVPMSHQNNTADNCAYILSKYLVWVLLTQNLNFCYCHSWKSSQSHVKIVWFVAIKYVWKKSC